MEPGFYYLNDLRFEVPSSFTDKSSTILEWPHEDGRIAMMVRRHPQAPEDFDRQCQRYKKELSAALTGFQEEAELEIATEIMHRSFSFRFRDQSLLAYHTHVLAQIGGELVIFVFGGVPKTQQIHVARGAVGFVEPGDQQHRTFQHEAFAVR